MRLKAERMNMDEKILETKLDEMWGHVTLYNAYQLFVQLTSKKMKNPSIEFSKKAETGAFDKISDAEYNRLLHETEAKAALWENTTEMDLLSLFFSATDVLPRNSMRNLVSNTNNALKSMSGAGATCCVFKIKQRYAA